VEKGMLKAIKLPLIKPKVTGNEIRILGSKNAGKTTYLAALLRVPRELQKQFPGLDITPLTDDATRLIEATQNIVEQGGKFSATDIGNEPDFYFQIKIPATRKASAITLELVVKDYAGELFEMAAQPHKWSELAPYFDDWCTTQSWMIMLTDWQTNKDNREYKPALEKLVNELNERAKVKPELQNLRIAVVMTKCERGELWPCRLDPEDDLFRVRLPQTHRLLTSKLPPHRLRFFACSSFGVLSDLPGDRDPRPNRYVPTDGSSAESNAYLREPDAWKPYGLISPLYWLSTGRVLHDEYL